MTSKISEIDVSSHQQSKPPVYALLDHLKLEMQAIPIDHNLLFFSEKRIEFEYNRDLFFNESFEVLSEEFKLVLTYFYVLVTVLLLSLIGFTGLLYSSLKFNETELYVNEIALGLLLVLFYGILLLIAKSNKAVILSKNLFTVFALLANSYFIICNQEVLSALIGSDFSASSMPLTLVLVVFTCTIRNVLFDSFAHYLIIVLYSIGLFFVMNLVFSPRELYSILCECLIILVIFTYQLIEVHIYCMRSKIIFWRKFSEEEATGNMENPNKNILTNFETESERLIFICEKIRTDIKFAVKAIIFKDVKMRLKEALLDVTKVKKIVGHSNFGMAVQIENEIKDLEDRAFINQNYIDLSIGSQGDYIRQSTFIHLLEHKSNAFNPEYGVNELGSVLESIGKNWSFDIWFVQETTGRSITIVGQYLFAKYGLLKRFKIPDNVLEKYLNSLEFHYSQNPYHNACHGADVLHSFMYFITNSDVQKFCTPIETLGCIIAGLAHDVGHPGLTNRYLVTTRDALAIQFNDVSVLENMHCSVIYQFLTKPGHNIFEWVDSEDWTCSRRVIVEMVLSTDMSKHFEILGKFRTRANTLSDINLEKFEDKLLVFSTGLKCADIGHSAKFGDLHQKWTKLVLEEFFKQGDLEKAKKLPVSMYCDRTTTNIPKSQAGFLRNICLPMYEAWTKYLNTDPVNRTLNELKKNLEYWEDSGKTRRMTQPTYTDKVLNIMPAESFAESFS